MTIKILSSLILAVIVLFLGFPVLAADTSIEIPNPLQVKTVPALIDNILNYIIGMATLILPLVIIYGAFLLMSSGGDPEKIITGRKTIFWTIVGYALIWLSKGITLIVVDILGGKAK
ncbi:MAG: hypothetical protein Q7S73_02425 [bacterium]|nr:hypothetical protein [bacterium]